MENVFTFQSLSLSYHAISFLVCRLSSRRYVHNFDFVNAINTQQKSWRATRYKEYENFALEELTRRAGGLYSRTSRYCNLLLSHKATSTAAKNLLEFIYLDLS